VGELDVSASGLPQAVLYANGEVVHLGTLRGGTFSSARAISETGDVVGWSGVDFRSPDVRNPSHAFLYRDGQMTDVGTLAGHFISGARDVNSTGWVVGWSEDFEEHQRAILHIEGRLYDLNDLIKGRSEWVLGSAESVNERGQIVGWGYLRGESRGFLLTPQHELTSKSK
jgi:probable HAF family extracellular repeat protein